MKQLGSDEKKMVWINGIYTFCSSMAAVFVNVYLYLYTGSLLTMAVYTIFRIAMYPFFFTLGGKIAEKTSYSFTLCMGFVMLCIQLIYVLGVNQNFALHPELVYIAAMIQGAGEGLFWISANTIHQLISDISTRSLYLSILGIAGSVASILSPLAASLLIMISGSDTAGYQLIFKIVLAVYAGMGILAYQLKHCRTRNVSFSVLKCMDLHKDRKWRTCMITAYLFGIRDSLPLMVAGLLVYNAIGQSGILYSLMLALFALASIVSYWIYSRTYQKKKLLPRYVRSGVIIASSTIVLVLFPGLFGSLYYGLVNGVETVGYGNGYNILTMNAIAGYSEQENIAGRVTARETYLSLGRITGMLMILLAASCLPENLWLPVSVTVISLMSAVTVLYTDSRCRKMNWTE